MNISGKRALVTGGASGIGFEMARQLLERGAWVVITGRRKQTLDHAVRKRLYDRVQQIAAENLPLICLASPNILVAARKDLGNFQPAILDHYTLWNVEQLYWRTPHGGSNSAKEGGLR